MFFFNLCLDSFLLVQDSLSIDKKDEELFTEHEVAEGYNCIHDTIAMNTPNNGLDLLATVGTNLHLWVRTHPLLLSLLRRMVVSVS